MIHRNKLLSLLIAACLIIGMLPAAVSAQGKTPVVDKNGTDGYAGNAILAENLDFAIDSDEKLAVIQPLGTNNNQAAGSPGKTAENAAENPEQPRCGNLHLPQHDFSEAELPSQRKSKTAANTYNVGDVKTIYSDYYDGKEADFQIEVAAVGDTCTIWRSVEHREQLTTQQAELYAKTLDEDIHDTMEKAFGTWSNADVDGDGKTAFVFYPMSFAGFFYGADLFTKDEAEWATGNVMDMLHMSTAANDTSVVLSTLVHELQHLINFAQTGGYCDSWLNETFSQSAIAVTGLSSSETVYEVPIPVDFANENGYSAPFIYKDWYVPSSEEMTSPPYGSWYLFGRYLAHQTEGMNGGGNAIYQSILSQLTASEIASEHYLDLGDLEDALEEIGYISGENGKASDIEEVITNYNIALYLREPSGIYSLSNNSESPSNVDGVQVDKIFQTSAALKEIPGGGAATLVINENMGSAKPENPGADIRFAGIETEFMNGAYAENADATMIWGDKISLISMDGPDSEIKYTTDGSKPFAGGQVYTEPIVVTEPMTLSFCTVSKDGDYSPTETVIVEEIITASVKASHSSGPVEKDTEITLSTNMNDTVIRYTTDGSAPSKDNGTVYKDAIKIETTTTVKAVAYSSTNEDILLSDIKIFVYEVEDGKGDRYEKNDTKDIATALSFPGEVNATIHNTKDSDWYSFTLDNGATLSLTLTPPAKSSLGLYLYDENGDWLAGSAWDNKSQNIRYEAKSGKYYLKVESTDKSFSAKNAYTLSLKKEMDASALEELDFSEMNMLTALSDKSESGSRYAYGLEGQRGRSLPYVQGLFCQLGRTCKGK